MNESRKRTMKRSIKRRKRRGFNLIELLMAMLFLSFVMMGVLYLNSSSNRSSMDAYFEFMATQLALEPIEIFRTFGYDWMKSYATHQLDDYPIGESEIKNRSIRHPAESTLFLREIILVPIDGTSEIPNAMRVKVRVYPKGQSRARAWLLRQDVAMESLIFERPK